MKICSVCLVKKSNKDFYKNSKTSSGLYSQCKECKHQLYYKQEKENQKKYRQNNKEKITQRRAVWYQKNKKRVRSNRKQKYYLSRKKILEKQKLYYNKNKQHILEKNKNWHRSNREKAIDMISRGTKQCKICGYDDIRFLQIDHINPKTKNSRSDAGKNLVRYILKTNNMNMFQVLCGNCNWIKHHNGFKNNNSRHTILGQKSKKEVLNHYSNNQLKCACCGYNNYTALQLDHISGSGTDHRKQLRFTNSGRKFYRWLIRNHFPPGLQVLCASCNHAKRDNRYCPHQLDKQTRLKKRKVLKSAS